MERQLNRANAPTSCFAGLVLGAASGFLFLEFPTAGLAVLAGAGVIVVRTGRGLAGIGGIFVGAGAVWVALFGRIKLTCTAEGGCFAPSIDTYLAVSVALLLIGLALSGLALVRARRH